MNDYLIKATDKNRNVRVFLARTTDLVNEAARRHKTSATAAAALGRVLTGAAIMGISDLKNHNDILTIRINGNGIAGTIIASADIYGNVRGLISNPQADAPSLIPGKLNVGAIVGRDGSVEVIKDLGLHKPFTGNVSLVSGEIAEDLANYYAVSEQIPSLVSLGVLVEKDLSIKSAGGLIVQAMPGASDKLLMKIEENISDMGTISKAIEKYEDIREILKIVFNNINYEILEEKSLAFKCNCSKDRILKIVAGFSEEEINDIFNNDEKLEINCNFCNDLFYFNQAEVLAVKSNKP